MRILTATLTAAAALVLASTAASATEIDPLHGQCAYSAPSCVDNGAITPVSNTSPTFWFTKSPDNGSGDFLLEVLIPNDVTNAASQSITINGTNTANASASGSFMGLWSTGQLDTFLGISASPTNPIGAFLPLTQTAQGNTNASGYDVYQLDFGTVTYGGGKNPTFSESYVFPTGAVILGFFDDSGSWVATANSGALLETGGGGGGGGGGGNPPPGVPEPATLALMGIALAGFAFGRKKSRKSE